MTASLYRKYRPQSFAEVIGQEHIKTTLERELEHSRTSHAYLFSGPRGLGKTTMARLLAKALNCENRKSGQSEPCNHCQSCQEISGGNSLSVLEIDAASHTGVDNVRENIISSARFTPSNGRFKVFIIDEVHMLSTSAFNALLKTLEEPPSHAVFVLATTEIHKVPLTIISRCQRFDFRKVSREALLERLKYLARQEKKRVDAEILETITHYAEGCVRDAETLLTQVLNLDEKSISVEQASLVLPLARFDAAIQLISHLEAFDAQSAIALVNQLLTAGVDLEQFTGETIEVLRKLMLLKVNPNLDEFAYSFNPAIEEQAKQLSQTLPLKDLVLMITTLINAKHALRSAAISQLPLEVAIVELCSRGEGTNTPPIVDKKENITHTAVSVAVQPPMKKAQPAETKKAQPIKKPTARIKLTVEQIKDRWEEVLGTVKKHNHSLASTLRLHQPTAVTDEGNVEISFKYRFHQQRIDELKNRQALEQVLEQIFGTPLRIQTILVENLEANANSAGADPEIDKLASTFGGHVIE